MQAASGAAQAPALHSVVRLAASPEPVPGRPQLRLALRLVSALPQKRVKIDRVALCCAVKSHQACREAPLLLPPRGRLCWWNWFLLSGLEG